MSSDDNKDDNTQDQTTWRDVMIGLAVFAMPALVIFLMGLGLIAVLFVLFLLGVI